MATPSGNAQTDTIGAPLTMQLRAEVKEDGVLKDGATVTWSVVAGGGAVAPTSSLTGLDGVATTTWTLGDVLGAQSARAALAGAGGSPVNYTATATAGQAAQISGTAGDGQSALLNSPFAIALAVKVGDRLNNGVAGATVNWAVGSGSLALDGATSSTNAQGIATMTASAGGTGGAGSIQATSTGAVNPAVFGLTVINASRQVNVGAGVLFRSARNSTQNPAVDTVQAGEAVFWLNGGSLHTVESVGSPSFTSSGNLQGAGASYTLTFANPGTYMYECAVHGAAMTGRIVVQ
jgi:plastocyanin